MMCTVVHSSATGVAVAVVGAAGSADIEITGPPCPCAYSAHTCPATPATSEVPPLSHSIPCYAMLCYAMHHERTMTRRRCSSPLHCDEG